MDGFDFLNCVCDKFCATSSLVTHNSSLLLVQHLKLFPAFKRTAEKGKQHWRCIWIDVFATSYSCRRFQSVLEVGPLGTVYGPRIRELCKFFSWNRKQFLGPLFSCKSNCSWLCHETVDFVIIHEIGNNFFSWISLHHFLSWLCFLTNGVEAEYDGWTCISTGISKWSL